MFYSFSFSFSSSSPPRPRQRTTGSCRPPDSLIQVEPPGLAELLLTDRSMITRVLFFHFFLRLENTQQK